MDSYKLFVRIALLSLASVLAYSLMIGYSPLNHNYVYDSWKKLSMGIAITGLLWNAYRGTPPWERSRERREAIRQKIQKIREKLSSMLEEDS